MDASTLSLEFRNDLAELENLRRIMDQFSKANSLSKRNAFELNLVVDEWFTNIVSYGFDDNEEHRIKIDIQITDREMMITIEDDGVPFDPTAVPKSELKCPVENRKVGGIGLHLINQIMNSVHYKRVRDKNILVLKKWLDEK